MNTASGDLHFILKYLEKWGSSELQASTRNLLDKLSSKELGIVFDYLNRVASINMLEIDGFIESIIQGRRPADILHTAPGFLLPLHNAGTNMGVEDKRIATPSPSQNNSVQKGTGGLVELASEQDSIAQVGLDHCNFATPKKKVLPLSDEKVLEHTAGLWRYMSIPADEPEPHPEYDARLTRFRGGSLIGARVRGKNHKHDGTNCDDWFEFDLSGDWVLIALSDGAGSKKYSRIGAKESCKEAIRYMKEKFTVLQTNFPETYEGLLLQMNDPVFIGSCEKCTEVVQHSVLSAINAVERAYENRKENDEYTKLLNRNIQLADFSGTLLVAAAIPVQVGNTQEHLIISCQIGDGLVATIDNNAQFNTALRLLGKPDGGDFAGETDFLTSPKMGKAGTLMERTRVERRKVSCLMVMTDGVADDYFPNDPQILRLFLDLQLNGIIGEITENQVVVTPENLELIKKIPVPYEYPWVNDPTVQVGLQYTNKIASATGLSLERLWSDRDTLIVSALQTLHRNKENGPEENLKIWLDNYVERGSFDDRTLVIFYSC